MAIAPLRLACNSGTEMDLYQPVKPTIQIVDDSPKNLSLLTELLQHAYFVRAVDRGANAFKVASQEMPDLILLDINMPDVDGYEVCRRLKANPFTCHIPIIFVTNRTEVHSEYLGMELGAVDYISYPISPPILLSRVNAHLTSAAIGKNLRISNEYLERQVLKYTRQLGALQDVAIVALAALAGARDAHTGNHLRRTQHYVRELGNRLRTHARFRDRLSTAMIDILFKCAPLHDIGNVGIPDRILISEGPYTIEEYEVMKTHTRIGRNAIEEALRTTGHPIEFLETAKELIYSHHENWDGTGYPQGLVGEAIPISARLMALADAYDRLTCRRNGKAGLSHAQAAQVIVDKRGLHFDPDVVDAFMGVSAKFQLIAQRFADTEAELRQKSELLARLVDPTPRKFEAVKR